MSYTKTTWHAGDIITSEKLNHLEGGVETTSNVVDSAVETGGIGYTDPDQLLISIEEETAVQPAIIELVDNQIYAFKIVDNAHPDGVVFEAPAHQHSLGVAWFVEDGEYLYAIDYADGTNQFSSFRGEWGSDPNPVSFYRSGEPHKIDDKYLSVAPMVVHFTSSDDTWSADVTPYEVWKAGHAYRPIVGIYSTRADVQTNTQYTFVTAYFNERSSTYVAVFAVLMGSGGTATKLTGSGRRSATAAECTWTWNE